MKRLFLVAAVGLALALAIIWPLAKVEGQSGSVTLIGAGDIADGFNLNLANSLATAALLNQYPNAYVFADGDLAYNYGTDGDFMRSYDPTWGRARARTIPVIGNHEYLTPSPAGYFSYFGAAAGDPGKGYYSLNLGAWHVIVLNSECSYVTGGCGVGSPQETWLRNDLAADSAACTLAFWHEPLYTSAAPGQGVVPATSTQTFWIDLYNFGHTEMIINGHAHNYERFAPQTPYGGSDPAKGIIEFIVGTGGESHMSFGAIQPNSLVQNSTAYGVLVLTLNPTSFSWQFVPVAGSTFSDSGAQACH